MTDYTTSATDVEIGVLRLLRRYGGPQSEETSAYKHFVDATFSQSFLSVADIPLGRCNLKKALDFQKILFRILYGSDRLSLELLFLQIHNA